MRETLGYLPQEFGFHPKVSAENLLGDLLERNTFWELKTRQATAQQMPDGTWQVRLDVDARKVAVDPQGAETNLAMNDPIEIGAYAANGRELHRALHASAPARRRSPSPSRSAPPARASIRVICSSTSSRATT